MQHATQHKKEQAAISEVRNYILKGWTSTKEAKH
jgi:hypothetical protein